MRPTALRDWPRSRRHLPDTEREQALHDALAAARTIHSETTRAQTLAALAPHLPDTLLLDALAAARTISDEIARAQSLSALALHLPDTEREDSGGPSTPVGEIAKFFEQRGKDAQKRAHRGLYLCIFNSGGSSCNRGHRTIC